MRLIKNKLSIVDEFEYQVLKRPNKLALIDEADSFSYEELNKKSNQLARYFLTILQAQHFSDIQDEPVIAFYFPRGQEAIISMIAVLKAGAAYLPLDLNLPETRINHILSNSKARFLITNRTLMDAISDKVRKEVDIVLLENELIDKFDNSNLKIKIDGSRIAYMMYTSGSTGVPHGVMIEQHSVVNLAKNRKGVAILQSDRMAHVSNLSFDAATFEVWGALLNGATLVCANNSVLDGVINFETYLLQNKITIVFLTAALFNLFAMEKPIIFRNLKYLMFGGDVANIKAVEAVLKLGKQCPKYLVNGYGPTETTTFATFYRVKRIKKEDLLVPIGAFLDNVYGYALDEHLKQCPIGSTGELYIGGAGVARSYINQPALDQLKFIHDPFNNGRRLYRTGDLVRRVDKNNFIFLGRNDLQVKIRGFRVELNEIEQTLTKHPDIKQAAVVVYGDDSEDKIIVAYCVLDTNLSTVATNSVVNYWEEVYDHLYSVDDELQTEMDFSGWESSFTHDRIPLPELKEWQNATVNRILSLKPSKLLEVGCGSGLLFFPLIASLDKYIGIDISQQVVSRLENVARLRNISNAFFAHGYAGEIDNISLLEKEADLDTIVINSVAMYFPGEEYLDSVLQQGIKKIKKGAIFIGDVRDNRLLHCFHFSVARFQNPDLDLDSLLELTNYNTSFENELAISPEYFFELKKKYQSIKNVVILPKRGEALHEMNRFRFDAVISIDAQAEDGNDSTDIVSSAMSIDWARTVNISEALSSRAESIIIKGYPNKRVWLEYHLLKKAITGEKIVDACTFESAMDAENILSVEELYQFAEKVGYQLQISLSLMGVDRAATYDLIFDISGNRFDSLQKSYLSVIDGVEYLTNNASREQAKNRPYSFTDLKKHISKILPEYMCPAQYFLVDNLPLNSNGKVDRKKLHSIVREDHDEKRVACVDSIQYRLILIWEDVFSLSKIKPNSNFISLGGNSILAIKIAHRINEEFKTNYPVAWVFTHQTIIEQSNDIRKNDKDFAEYQPFIKFNISGLLDPLFIVHPGLIGAECYAELANLLDRRIKVFGVDSYNLYHDEMKDSILELASYYAKQFFETFNYKTVSLAGWSMGGLVAYEMARRLMEHGVEVKHLFLIDSDPPNYENDLIKDDVDLDIKALNKTPEYIVSYVEKLPEYIINRVLSNLNHDLRLCVDYSPTGSFDGKTVFFEAEYWRDASLLGKQINAVQAWRPFISQLTKVTIPGDHFSIMDAHNVQIIANTISQVITGSVYSQYPEADIDG